MYKIGDMVRHHVHYEVSVLAFVTAVHSRDDSMHRLRRDYITITYLKPREGIGRIDRNILVSYPYHDVSLVSSTEAKSNE